MTVRDRAMAWWAGHDKGASSEAIWMKMMLGKAPRPDHPRDPGDLGRCIRLLDMIPEWRLRIGEMGGVSSVWGRYTDSWKELEALYRSELDRSDGRAPETYERMLNIRGIER